MGRRGEVHSIAHTRIPVSSLLARVSIWLSLTVFQLFNVLQKRFCPPARPSDTDTMTLPFWKLLLRRAVKIHDITRHLTVKMRKLWRQFINWLSFLLLSFYVLDDDWPLSRHQLITCHNHRITSPYFGDDAFTENQLRFSELNKKLTTEEQLKSQSDELVSTSLPPYGYFSLMMRILLGLPCVWSKWARWWFCEQVIVNEMKRLKLKKTRLSPQWWLGRSTTTHVVLDLHLLILGFGESYTIVHCVNSQPANVS